MLSLLVGLSACCFAPPAGHEAANPLYQELLEKGLLIGPNLRAKLPPPTMPDGLSAAQQQAAIRKLIGGDYSYDEFTRRSVVAPQILRIRDVIPSDPQAPARGVDVWFVAYGDFRATEDQKFLDRLLNADRGEGKAHTLTREQLAKRKITLADAKHEQFGHVEFDFLDRVRLKVTGRAVWSKTAESVVAAAEIDPRFRGDPEFPDEWRSITKQAGKVQVGPPHPYSGAGLYLKVTKLAEPKGAIFIEEHIIFAEPRGWFNGANLLRSKLPPVVQHNVRTMRREWLKASAK
jgi:hypothetical protein